MFDSNSLVAQLGWRLALVLSVGTSLQMAWLFVHFRGAEENHGAMRLMCQLFDFFKDAAWTTPAIGVATFLVCAAGMRRHLEPLRQISERALAFLPEDKHTPLPVDRAPSEVQPLVASVNTGYERLVEAVHVQRRFTANAAHELRTPMAVIKAGLERLPPGEDVLLLRQESERMARIVGQLLSLARFEGCNHRHVERLDVAGLVRQVAEPLTHLASAADVTLAFEVEQEPEMVVATEEAITEIARNLVENAVGHAPAGSEITIALSRHGLLSIADRGPGIPEHLRGHLFERFWRGPWTTRPGSGLGLAIVAEACQRVGATVRCCSAPGGGARFEVQFVTAS